MEKPIINCDIGEDESDLLTAELIPYLDAANICCGVHAGSPVKTGATIALAMEQACMIGAHPGMPSAGGRGDVDISVESFRELLETQLRDFVTQLELQNGALSYVKLHGSLYHAVEKDVILAQAYLTVLSHPDLQSPAVFARAGGDFSVMAKSAGFRVYEEVFFDRGYQSNGTLVRRANPGAVLSAAHALSRFSEWYETGNMETIDGGSIPLHADTVCVHGDSPDALKMLRALTQIVER